MHEEAILTLSAPSRVPWNKGKLIGAKPPLRQKHVWSIRGMLQNDRNRRDLAMFNFAIDEATSTIIFCTPSTASVVASSLSSPLGQLAISEIAFAQPALRCRRPGKSWQRYTPSLSTRYPKIGSPPMPRMGSR